MDSLKLDTAVGLLTRESKHRLVDAEGNAQWVTADPLLVQLRIAISHSTAPATFKASAGTPLPLSVGAFDLLEEIADVTEDHWWQTYALHLGRGDRSLAGQIRAWAMAARCSDALLAEAEQIICGWVRQIEALFEPARRWEIKGACPSCGKRKVQVRADDDGTVYAPALSVVYDKLGRPDRGECAACGNTWEAIETLARDIASQ